MNYTSFVFFITLTFFLFICSRGFAQNTVVSSVNSGGIASNGMVYSVGEVFVEPISQGGNGGFISVLGNLETSDVTLISNPLTVEVFPNPSSAAFSIRAADSDFLSVCVVSLDGKIILSQQIPNGKNIDLSGFSNGQYWLLVADPDKHSKNILKISKIK